MTQSNRAVRSETTGRAVIAQLVCSEVQSNYDIVVLSDGPEYRVHKNSNINLSFHFSIRVFRCLLTGLCKYVCVKRSTRL